MKGGLAKTLALGSKFGPLVAALLALTTIVSTLSLWRSDHENKRLQNDLARATIEAESLKQAALKPQFSVQYLALSISVYENVLANREDKKERPFQTRAARESYERLWSYPLIDRQIGSGLQSFFESRYDLAKTIAAKEYSLALGEMSEGDWPNRTVLVLSAFGGSIARDVELIYDDRHILKAPFLPSSSIFEASLIGSDAAKELARQGIKVSSQRKRLRLGDIAPGDGRMIEILAKIELPAWESDLGRDREIRREFNSSHYLVPVAIRFRTLAGETIQTPIRAPLNFPVPFSNGVEGLG